MKFFTAVKTASFADAAFKAAGLDLEAAASSGNVDVLKTALASAAAARPASPDVEQTLAAAAAENKDLNAALVSANNALTAAKADAEKFAAVSAALKDAGIDASDAAKIKDQIAAKNASAAVTLVARAGHDPIADNIAPEAGNKKAAAKSDESGPKGRDRLAADFHKQAYELNRKPSRN